MRSTSWPRVTLGKPWPDGTPCPDGDVLVLSAEDGLSDTVRPRMDAAGGDPDRVTSLTEVSYTDEHGHDYKRSITLADIGVIEQGITQLGAKLVVVDVLMAFLPGKVDSHRDQDIRTVLSALSAMTERTGCCLLLLRHLNKGAGGNPLYRGGGSIGIVGAARAALLAAHDPDDEGHTASLRSRRAISPRCRRRSATSPDDGCARVQWLGATTHQAGDLLGRVGDDEDRTERDEAADWLTDYLIATAGSAAPVTPSRRQPRTASPRPPSPAPASVPASPPSRPGCQAAGSGASEGTTKNPKGPALQSWTLRSLRRSLRSPTCGRSDSDPRERHRQGPPAAPRGPGDRRRLRSRLRPRSRAR